MAAIFQTKFSNAFILNENVWISIDISIKFVPWTQINNIPALVHIMVGADQATSHYLNHWCLVYWRKYASLGLNELVDTDMIWYTVSWYRQLHSSLYSLYMLQLSMNNDWTIWVGMCLFLKVPNFPNYEFRGIFVMIKQLRKKHTIELNIYGKECGVILSSHFSVMFQLGQTVSEVAPSDMKDLVHEYRVSQGPGVKKINPETGI